MAKFTKPSPVVVLLALAIIGVMVGGALWYVDSRRRACEEWQDEYRAQDRAGGGVFDFVNQGPLAQMRRDRPDGCTVPKWGRVRPPL
jgi:hypothetical protein